jgi:hypothetical protein
LKIELGQKVADRITGFSGLVTGKAEYITGCNQILVQPELNKDGAFVEGRWIDEDRAEIVNAKPFTLKVTAPGPDKPAPVK